MKTTMTRRPCAGEAGVALAALMTAAVLAGCGGGGSSPAPAAVDPPAPAPATTTAVPVSVIDGAIANAVVCLDLNDNGACDTGEPTAKTSADGKATLDLPIAEAGKHAVVAQVGTDAVDADHGPVTQAFVLKAPADQPAVVSPLTTLVQAQAASTGSTTAEAEAYLRSVAGLSVSLLSDYTQATGGSTSQAGTLARLVVLATQQQAAALTTVVGTTDLSGSRITTTDVTTAVTGSVLSQLPNLAAASVDPVVTGAADRATALTAAAQTAMADAALTASSAAALIGTDKLAAQSATVAVPPTTAPVGSATVRMFAFTDPSNWSYRAFLATPQDNTLDADGRRRYYDVHAKNTAGTIATWGFGTVAGSKDDLHWNGSAWVGCTLGTRGWVKALNASGSDTVSNYCDSYTQNTQKRANVDIAGKTLREVVETIRTYPGGDIGLLYANYGPTDLSLLGTDAFPSGSVMTYQTNVSAALPAVGYTPGAAAVQVTKAAIAAGGDARTGSTTGGGCAGVTFSTPIADIYDTPATLEAMVAGTTGKPCVYNPPKDAQNAIIDSRNEWFGSTLNAGTVAGAAVIPAGSGSYYSTTAQVRIAFTGAGNAITWYRCLGIANGGSTRNCDAIGAGAYAIATLGDARIMTLSGAPPLALQTSSERVFVERAGKVYSGYRNRAGTVQYVSLNLPASNALFAKLGVPVLVPQ